MNRLSLERQTQIIGGLVEGNSIRSVERMTNTHRDTIMRLMVQEQPQVCSCYGCGNQRHAWGKKTPTIQERRSME